MDPLLENEMCSAYIIGSSAQVFSLEIETPMRSRLLSLDLFPFSFHEYFDSKNIMGTP